MFDPADYLHLAKDLFASDSGDPLFEAKQRSAISRAYYGVFVPARAKGCPKAITHSPVFRAFKNRNDHDSQSFGRRLETLYGDRCDADYGDYIQDPYWKAAEVIAEAEELAKLLSHLPA